VRALRAGAATGEEELLSMRVGWCIEWLQAFFLVADDMMDHSITRRGQPCWYKVPKVGLNACNDCIVLEACIYKILKRHASSLPCYVHLLELFHDVTYQTSCGQLIDLITAPIGVVDLSKYTMETYMRIVTYKTAFYTFYLPAACAMHVCGLTDEAAFRLAREICIRLGQFFQIQDDYLDCYGSPEVIGKIGTDIEDNKCSWLVVQALLRCSPQQRAVVEANYGQADAAKVATIKALYAELELERAFKEYEEQSYVELSQLIRDQSLLPHALFGDMLSKIYKRSK
jgi:farnesyl diphosphate synthase